MRIESSLDFVYLLNSSNSIGSAYIDSLHHFLKQNNFKLQVEDIAVSNRTPVAVIAQSLRHEVGNDYKEELCEVLSEMKSIPKESSYDGKQYPYHHNRIYGP
jgi:hypothetical protein